MLYAGKTGSKREGYVCEACNFYSHDKTKFERHTETNKHIENKKGKGATTNAKLICDCGKSYKHASSFYRHTKTCKKEPNGNKMLTNDNIMVTHSKRTCTCICGKEYNHRSALSRHKKMCPVEQKSAGEKCEMLVAKPIMTEAEFQSRLVNTLKEILPQMAFNNITNNNNHVTNNNNNITNNNRVSNNQINIFLNEKCADAMSIQQFAKQLTFTIDDVLMKKHDALVKVINQNLGPLEVTERPVHCTNVARRRWHVKDETEGWRNDDGSTLVRRVNNSLLRKSPAQYAETFPGWSTQPIRQDEYVQIVRMTSSELEPKAEGRVLTNVGDAVQLDGTTVGSH